MVRGDSGRGDGQGRVTASEGGVRRVGCLGDRALQRKENLRTVPQCGLRRAIAVDRVGETEVDE